MNMPLSLEDYLAMARGAPKKWDPDPFQPHPDGDWIINHFESVVAGVTELLKRYADGEVARDLLLHGKDNDRKVMRDRLNFWLYYQHHPGSEKWKLLGQHYWSVGAWRAWRDWRAAGNRSLPKRGSCGSLGLTSEHVVPKKVMQQLLLAEGADVRYWLERNLCCVVTVGENRCLPPQTHPKAEDPWLRHKGSGIVLLNNPDWSDEEIDLLFRHGLLDRSSAIP
jgi:hypothetical protein